MPFPKFTTLEEIPEAFRESYEERDGAWVPKDVEDVTSLKTAFERQKAEANAAKAELRKLKQEADAGSQGVKPEVLAKLREEIKAEIEAEFKTPLTAAQQELRVLKLDAAVKAQLAKAGVRGERVDTLYKLIADQVDLGEAGTPVHKQGKPLGDWITKTLATEYPEFFASTIKGGSSPQQQGTLPTGPDAEKMLTENPSRLLAMANEQKAA
jgi:signal transduction histidine kinase